MLEPTVTVWNNNYSVHCPSSIETIKFYATKYPYDVWGESSDSYTWCEVGYFDENGNLIGIRAQTAPQGTNIPVTLDYDIEFGTYPAAKSALFKVWIYSPIYDQSTQYNVTITRT